MSTTNLGKYVETSLLRQCTCIGVGCLQTDGQTFTTQQYPITTCKQLTSTRHCIA